MFLKRKTQTQKLGVNRPLLLRSEITSNSFCHTGRGRLIRSHSLARFCFELSGNLN